MREPTMHSGNDPEPTSYEEWIQGMTEWEMWKMLPQKTKNGIREGWLNRSMPSAILQPILAKKKRREWLQDELYVAAFNHGWERV